MYRNTEQIVSSSNAYYLYLGSAQFEPHPQHWLPWLRFFMVLIDFVDKCQDYMLKTNYSIFLSKSFEVLQIW
jgi:hypothetical protein